MRQNIPQIQLCSFGVNDHGSPIISFHSTDMISHMNKEACLGHGFFMCEIDSVHVYPVCWGYILAQNIPVNFNDSEPGKKHFDFHPIYVLVSSQPARQVDIFSLLVMRTNQ